MNRELLEKELNKDMPALSGKNVYVWGTGHIARLYIKGLERESVLKIRAFCDSRNSGDTFGAWAMVSTDEVLSDSNAFVLICSWQKKVLIEVGEILKNSHIPFMNMDECIFKLHKREILANYDGLSDNISKEVYSEVIISRMKNEMPDARIYTPNHYFSIPQTLRYGQEVFVNCGAYTGDTVERYIWEKTSFKSIYAFEPDRKSYNAMQTRIRRLCTEWNITSDKIKLYNSGVGATNTTLTFSDAKGMGSLFVAGVGG